MLDNLVKKQAPDFDQIEAQIRRARKDLAAASATLDQDPTWTVAIAYHIIGSIYSIFRQ